MFRKRKIKTRLSGSINSGRKRSQAKRGENLGREKASHSHQLRIRKKEAGEEKESNTPEIG